MTEQTKPTSAEVNRSSATKLTEPVQVGLWYETKAGAIVKIDNKHDNEDYPFDANNGEVYSDNGFVSITAKSSGQNLIRCLGADPFKQVDISKKETTTQFERIFTAVLGGFCVSTEGFQREDLVQAAIKLTQEAIKQLKEIGE